MPRNDFRFVIGDCQKFRRAGDRSADASARSIVNIRKHPVKENVARLQHIAFLKMNINIRIRVCRRNVHKRNFFPVHRDPVVLLNGLLRQSLRR